MKRFAVENDVRDQRFVQVKLVRHDSGGLTKTSGKAMLTMGQVVAADNRKKAEAACQGSETK